MTTLTNSTTRLTAAALLTTLVGGCGIVTQMISGKSAAPTGAGGDDVARVLAAREEARKKTRDLPPSKFFDVATAWFDAFDQANGLINQRCDDGSRDDGSRDDGCAKLTGLRDEIVREQGEYFDRIAGMDPMPPAAVFNAKLWIAKPGFYRAMRGRYPVAKWAAAADRGAQAHTRRAVAEAGSMAEKTAGAGDGQCTLHTDSSRKHDLDDMTYFVDEAAGQGAGRIWVRCTLPRDLSQYPRSRPDTLAVLFYDGLMAKWEDSGWSINATRTSGRTVELEVSVAAVRGAMKRRSNNVAGHVNAIQVAYTTARITGYEEVVRNGRIEQDALWKLTPIATGTGLLAVD